MAYAGRIKTLLDKAAKLNREFQFRLIDKADVREGMAEDATIIYVYLDI